MAIQSSLDIAGCLLPDPQQIALRQRHSQEATPSSDLGGGSAYESRLSDFLARVEQRHAPLVSNSRSDDRRSVDWCGLHLRITESYQAGRQSLAHPTQRFACGWRMNNRSLDVDAHGRYRVLRSVPPRGGVALPAAISWAIQCMLRAFADVVDAAIVQTLLQSSFSSTEA